MKFDGFDSSRPLDLVLLGRAAIDLNPLDYYKTLAESTTYRKYLGGSPANIAVGLSRLQKKVGFIGKISDDRFGDFVEDTFRQEGVEISHLTRCKNGEKLGLTFTEILSEHESSILMYRHAIADLQLEAEDVDEAYIKSAKALLISGTSLAASPSREAALKAVMLAKKTQTPIIFDIDYRAYNWKNPDEIAVYYSLVAQESTVIIGSREEYDLTQRLLAPGLDDRETARFWCAKKAAIVVIKHGKQGSTAYTCQGDSFSIKPFPVKALKSFGGGDGYASAFLYGLFENWPLRDCLELGSASASMLVKSHGCSADMPSLEAIKDFIAASKAQYGEDVCF